MWDECAEVREAAAAGEAASIRCAGARFCLCCLRRHASRL